MSKFFVLAFTFAVTFIFINAAEDLDCKKTRKGMEYRGKISITQSGRTCQSWSSRVPHRIGIEPNGEKNYCRNTVAYSLEVPWCYTMDPNKRRETCNIPRCPMPGITGYTVGNPGFQYKLYTTKLNYKDAMEVCEKDGTYLVMPKSKKSLDYILTSFGEEKFYIGVVKEASGRPWKYDDGTLVQRSHLPWEYSQFHNYKELCSAVWGNKKIHDLQCEQELSFLCEATLR